ncbi:type II toxin-antitoxin system RelE/ParE family toxin [Pectobacterium peruviense]|uniref:type II toxin-antitoxin system RelE/ParE family toxin n=1 Tax=Pectobacterium peruviense TaxID=2066479 RepID=UPI0021D53B2E|nr:type II toxin-antitoxin system RelE/ParE family toxin [Pectobacterium peruviense]
MQRLQRLLRTASLSHQIGIKRKELGQGLHSFPLVRHTLFFLYETDSVIVVRILHQSQGIVRYLKWLGTLFSGHKQH